MQEKQTHLAPGTEFKILVLYTMEKSLDAAIATRDNLLQLVCSAIEAAYKLYEYICLNEDQCDEDRIDYGLYNVLEYWKGIFNGTISINHGHCKLIL